MTNELKPEWKSEHVICSYDVDTQAVACLPALCRFMQEAAYQHAEHLKLGRDFFAKHSMAWVLARLHIEMDSLPGWGDTVCLSTWPSGRDRLFFYRDFCIMDGEGRRVLRAASAWSLIDVAKRERVHPDRALFDDLPIGVKVLDSRPGRLKGSSCSGGQSTPVTYGDLDLNGHVNNVRYIEWMLNSLALEHHRKHAIGKFEINYLTEAVYGQSVSVCVEETGPLQFDHAVRIGESELCRARSVWKETGV